MDPYGLVAQVNTGSRPQGSSKPAVVGPKEPEGSLWRSSESDKVTYEVSPFRSLCRASIIDGVILQRL